MKFSRLFLLVVLSVAPLFSCVKYSNKPVTKILVDKSERAMQLVDYNGDIVKEYNVAIGSNTKGDKVMEGDKRTPEGLYRIELKKPNSKYYKAMRISYPSPQDRELAAKLGVSPGGDVMIHGEHPDYNVRKYIIDTQNDSWTEGCVAVTNREIDEIYRLVDLGTPVFIRP